MPKVHFVAKARKANSVCKKGESYYWWEFRYGGKRYSKNRPRPSQLTQSKMSGALAAQEALEDALEDATCKSDITSALDEAAQAIRDVAQEYEDAIENMPESLQDAARGGEHGDEKINGLNEWADALESDSGDVESVEASEHWDSENHDGEEAPDDVLEHEPELFAKFEADKKLTAEEQERFDKMLTAEEHEEYMQAMRDAVGNADCPL
jgi:hypothetical protein